eukprot:Opistho-2@65794
MSHQAAVTARSHAQLHTHAPAHTVSNEAQQPHVSHGNSGMHTQGGHDTHRSSLNLHVVPAHGGGAVPHTSEKGARLDVANAAVTRAESTDDDAEDEKFKRRIRLAASLYIFFAALWAYVKGLLRLVTGGKNFGPIALSSQTEYRTSFSPTSGLPMTAPLRYPLSAPSVRKKTLVLDLDETLIHSTVRGLRSRQFDLKIDVVIDRIPCLFYVYKRPHVERFLTAVAAWYNVVVFTASLRQYGDPVIDSLDCGRGLIQRRYFRESCIQEYGNYVKDLSKVEPDLSSVLIIDNSPGAYAMHPENAIPIVAWTKDPDDDALLDLIPFLCYLHAVRDVRSILSLRLRA